MALTHSFKVRLFQLTPEAKPPTTPAPPPKEIEGFAVDANDIDGARERVYVRLENWGHKVRAVSCLADKSADLAAIVYPKETRA